MVRTAASLSSEVGRIDGTARVADPGLDQPGFLAFDPNVPMRPGRYEVEIEYSSQGAPAQTASEFDVFDFTRGRQIMQAPLPGTRGAVARARYPLHLAGLTVHQMVLRDRWDGAVNLKVYGVRLRRL